MSYVDTKQQDANIVTTGKEEGIGIITINRPEKINAITDDMLDRLPQTDNAVWGVSTIRRCLGYYNLE